MRIFSAIKHIFSWNAEQTAVDPAIKEYVDQAVGNAMEKATETEAVVEQGIEELIQFGFGNLPGTLKHMGIGMLSIFIVIGVIVLLIVLLQKLTNRQPRKDTDQ